MTQPSPRLSANARWLTVVTLVAVGLGAGWFMRPPAAGYFDYVYAVLEPAGLAAMSVGLLARPVKGATVIVPFLIIAVLLNVATRPQAPALSAIGIASGLSAIAAIPLHRVRVALVATIVCAAAITASMLAGLQLGAGHRLTHGGIVEVGSARVRR